jgi:small subunit ribosomal protein S20
LANSKQAKKRVRQNEKSRRLNSSQKSAMRTYIKKVNAAILSGDAAAAQEAFQNAQPLIDRAARKGLIHVNKAARNKSKMIKRIKAMA